MHQDPSGPGVALEKSTIPEKSGFSGSFGPGRCNIGVFKKGKMIMLPICCSWPMSGAGSASGLARRGRGRRAREAREARRQGLAA